MARQGIMGLSLVKLRNECVRSATEYNKNKTVSKVSTKCNKRTASLTAKVKRHLGQDRILSPEFLYGNKMSAVVSLARTSKLYSIIMYKITQHEKISADKDRYI